MSTQINMEKFKLGKQIDMIMKETENIRSAAEQLHISIGWASKARKYYLEQRTNVRPFETELRHSMPYILEYCTAISNMAKKESITNKDLTTCYRKLKDLQDCAFNILVSAENTDLIQNYHKVNAKEEERDELNRRIMKSEFFKFADFLEDELKTTIMSYLKNK